MLKAVWSECYVAIPIEIHSLGMLDLLFRAYLSFMPPVLLRSDGVERGRYAIEQEVTRVAFEG